MDESNDYVEPATPENRNAGALAHAAAAVLGLGQYRFERLAERRMREGFEAKNNALTLRKTMRGWTKDEQGRPQPIRGIDVIESVPRSEGGGSTIDLIRRRVGRA